MSWTGVTGPADHALSGFPAALFSRPPANTWRIPVSGIQEILLIVLIIGVIWFLPRLVNRGGKAEPSPARLPERLGGGVRLAVLASGLWIAGVCLWLRPWETAGAFPSLLFGVAPVALGWGLAWVVNGFR